MTENTQQPQRDGTPAPTGEDVTIGAAIGRGVFALEIAAMAALCFAAGGLALWFALLRYPA